MVNASKVTYSMALWQAAGRLQQYGVEVLPPEQLLRGRDRADLTFMYR